MVDWSSTYLCSVCNATRDILKVLEEDTDPDSGNPYQKMEMECGHIQKRIRISKQLKLRWQIQKSENIRVEPVVTDGTPSVAVSGKSHSIVAGGPINIGLEGAKNNKIFINITNSEGNNNFVHHTSNMYVKISYKEILEEIDKEFTNEIEKKRN